MVDFLLLVPMRDPNSNSEEHAVFHAWQSVFITRCVNTIELNPAALDDHTQRTVRIPESIKQEIRLLKELTRKYVINSRSLVTQQHGKRQVIADLFNILMKAFETYKSDKKNPEETILSEDHQNQREKIAKTLSQHRIRSRRAIDARLTADIISSLTDAEALALHKRLTGINPGSVLDLVLYSSLHLH